MVKARRGAVLELQATEKALAGHLDRRGRRRLRVLFRRLVDETRINREGVAS